MQRYPAQFHLSSNLYLWGQGLGNSREKWILIWYILYFDGKKKILKAWWVLGTCACHYFSNHCTQNYRYKRSFTQKTDSWGRHIKRTGERIKCFDFSSLFTVQLILLLRPLIVLPSNYLFLWLIKWVLYIYLSLITAMIIGRIVLSIAKALLLGAGLVGFFSFLAKNFRFSALLWFVE